MTDAPAMLTDAQAAILTRMAGGATLTHSLLGDRLWSLLEDPWTVFDDVSPRQLRASGLIALAQRGSVEADHADAYRMTIAGHTALTLVCDAIQAPVIAKSFNESGMQFTNFQPIVIFDPIYLFRSVDRTMHD